MVHKEKNHAFRMLVLIANSKLGENATEVFLDNDIPIHYHLNGIGTASSEMVDILGLGSSDKTVLISVLPKEFANQMLFKLRRELRIGRVNSGIAFTLQMAAQKNVEASTASLLMSLESVFAVLSGWVVLGDTLSIWESVGCVLIFIAIMLSQIPDKKRATT